MKHNVLHTSSIYGIKETDLTFYPRKNYEIEDAIRRLEANEKILYKEFEADDYEQFINKLRECFNDNDMNVIKRFQPDELSKRLQKYASSRSELFNQTVQITLNLENIRNSEYNVREEFNRNNEMFQIKMNTKNLAVITLNFNHGSIKEALNYFIKGHNFKTGSEVMTNVDSMINDLISQKAFTVHLQDKNNPNKFTEEFKLSPFPNFPWGLDKKSFDDAVKKNDTAFLNKIQQAVRQIKNFILYELGLGSSRQLNEAIKITWQQNFDKYENNPALFFSGGKTERFISGVQGAMGEFQAALIFNFLQLKLDPNGKYAKIIGNIYREGTSEQLKTDVSVAQKIGLQIKNVSIIENAKQKSLLRDLETNIHPNKIAKQLEKGQAFLDFIANYYFNKTFQDETYSVFQDVLKMLGSYLGEVMNMTINDEIEDTISFYLIGGQYLVPASKILRAAEELDLYNNLEITSTYTAFSDLAFEIPFHISSNGKRAPLYVEYWRHPKGNQNSWDFTSKNTELFNKLVSNRISIRTHFNLISDIEKYALFVK